MGNQKNSGGQVQYLPIGMCLGMSIGTAIGTATDNLSIGMCIGMSIGMCIGALIDAKNRKSTAQENGETDTKQDHIHPDKGDEQHDG